MHQMLVCYMQATSRQPMYDDRKKLCLTLPNIEIHILSMSVDRRIEL